MLYVFQVDTGTMITFDMNLALNSVSHLKEAIWQNLEIPLDRQVLLVSGGECLDPGSRVCNYSSGTDTNPIFLFNKSNIESSPTSSGQHPQSSGSLENLTGKFEDMEPVKEQIKGCLEMEPSYLTVVTRAQLAQQLYEQGKSMVTRCEQLIHDQHLQHQGWAAVVANLEDVVNAFRQRAENFENTFLMYLGTKDDRIETLRCFEQDIEQLRNIPIIPSLLSPDEAGSGTLSILDWIISQDNQKLTSLSTECYKGLAKLDVSVIEALQREKRTVIEKAENPSMKEIKGLEDRFFSLDQLMLDANNVLQDQLVLAQAFVNNQNSANVERDSSIFPDLCQAHQTQLMVMFKKHQHLDELRRKCGKAKNELIGNLNSRLKWIMHIQHSLTETSSKLTVYNESLRRLRFQIEVVEQIHVAAEIYGEAVMEVVRRKKFSEAYNKWANTIAETMDKIHTAEINHRQNFSARFEGHFLSALFAGLEDIPVLFATKRAQPFDLNLPTIPPEEIEMLRAAYPALPTEEELPDFSLDITGSESSARSALEMENVNLKLEVEKTKFELQTKEDEIQRLQGLHAEEKVELENELKEKCEAMEGTVAGKDGEITQLKSQVEALINELNTLREVTSTEIEQLREELAKTREEHLKVMDENRIKFESMLSEAEARGREEKEAELKALKEKNKADMEGLRSRYKLMASFDQRSPSDMQDKSFESFEKVPRTEELLVELAKIADLSQKSPNESSGILSQIKGIMTKLEGSSVVPQSPEKGSSSPALLRARASIVAASSEEGPFSRVSIEAEDDPNSANTRSVFGLDTSAIDATAMCIDEIQTQLMTKELADLLAPPARAVYVATNLAKSNRVSIQSCKTGDAVFLYFNSSIKAYIVYGTYRNVYFLHSDCLKLFDYDPDNPVGAITGHVADREYCVARRVNNRYRVPLGFHFYRIRVEGVEIVDMSEASD